MKFNVIGAGLAGVEAAWHIANSGYKVNLYEQKPNVKSKAHKSDYFAELVCSNSLKAERIDSASGLLKEEMTILGSLTVPIAKQVRVDAGGALAVDRNLFAEKITEAVLSNKNINVIHVAVENIPRTENDVTVVATGPLTEGIISDDIRNLTGEYLSFYDAASPIVTKESIDMNHAFFASRYGRGSDDYINCPLDKKEYENFINEIVNAESAIIHDFDVYEGCMPIEKLAKRGIDSPRFGPMKPVGLIDPITNKRPWAVVQLRSENAKGSMYNLVGFQTNLKFTEQKRVFSLIPALRNAEFVRFGVMHRNSFLNSPMYLNEDLSLKKYNNIFFAGQITGVEGYMESASMGILAGINSVRFAEKRPSLILGRKTMIGALANYISDNTVTNFQPMGASFGLLENLNEKIKDKRVRYATLAQRAIDELKGVCL